MDKENKKTNEIDLIALFKVVLKQKKIMGFCIGISACIGVIVALSLPKAYTSRVILAPEISASSLGMNSSLADMASSFGIDLNNKSSMDAIYPEIYPTLMTSNDFIIQLFEIPIELNKTNLKKTYYNHLVQDSKVPFWAYPKMLIVEMFKPKEPKSKKRSSISTFSLTNQQYSVINGIRSNISCIVDKKTSLITISVTDQDPQVSAIIADTLQRRLQKYITIYRTKKARKDVIYYKKLLTESKIAYSKAQQKYAAYSDANEDAILQSVESKRDELENEMQLKFNTYSQLATQLQAAQAKVQENTPAFAIIENPSIPHEASSTPRSLIVLVFIFLGLACDVIWVAYKNKLTDN